MLLHPSRPYFLAPTGTRCGSPMWRAASSATIQIARTYGPWPCQARRRPVKVRIAASPNGPMRSAFSAPRGAARPGRSGTQCPWFDPGGGFHTAERRKMPRFVGGLRSTSPCTRGVRHDCVRSPSSCGTSIPMEGFAHDAPAAASLLRCAPEHTGGCVYSTSTGRECQVSTIVVTLTGSMAGRRNWKLRTGYALRVR